MKTLDASAEAASASPSGSNKMRAYMGFDRQMGSSEGACLIFAHSARQAKVTAFPILSGWGVEWIDVAVRYLPDDFHQEQANPEKFAAGIPHVIETPSGCPQCEIWGHELMESGLCESCDSDREDDSLAKPADASEAEPDPTVTSTLPTGAQGKGR